MTNVQNETGFQKLSLAELIDRFSQLGLQPAQVVLVHSALRTVGNIEGGAGTVIDALLEIVGPAGTLVFPTFAHEAEADPIIDPRVDRSEMGGLTETARLRPDALRSTAFRHSVAAIGRRAKLISEVDPVP